MKSRIIPIFTIAITLLLFLGNSNHLMAQGKSKGKGKNKNKEVKAEKKGGPPAWAPAHGYRAQTRYVYFKEQDTYYDLERGVYISLKGKNWEVEVEMPKVLENIDLSAAAKIEIDYQGTDPYVNHSQHKKLKPNKN